MSLRADMYRQKAAEAKNRAAEASNPHVKSAFKEVARGWLLAEQMEWMEHQDEAKEGEIRTEPRNLGAPTVFRQRSPHPKVPPMRVPEAPSDLPLGPSHSGGVLVISCGGKSVMKTWSVISLLFAAAILASVPISPQVTPRGLELSVNEAKAITYGRYRRTYRRGYRRAYRRGYYYGYPYY
jgi:hypothetical protein